jgi:cytochrome c biogenesis protein CcdA
VVASLIALIASVAALDSLNPSTLGPALFMAGGRRPGRDVSAFAAGVLGVSAVGGLALLFGPGRALLANIARPSPHTQHLGETLTGAALVGAATVLWLLRHRFGRRLSKTQGRVGGSAFVIGAGIMAVELPTAFPYFAGLLAIVESRRAVLTEVALVFLYNFVFVAPLLALLALVAVGGPAGERIARRARLALEAHAQTLVPATLGAIGAVLLAIGGSRL